MELPWIDEVNLALDVDRVYHYTAFESLAAILKSGGLLARPFDQTNDATELRALEDLLIESVVEQGMDKVRARLVSEGYKIPDDDSSFEALMRAEAGHCFTALINSMPRPPQIICFSEHQAPAHKRNGLLTMWRLYADGGRGVSLGFNVEKLRKQTEELVRCYAYFPLFIERIAYGATDPVVRRRLEDFRRLPDLFAHSIFVAAGCEQYVAGEWVPELLKFYVFATTTKHEDFEDEREVRLIAATVEDIDGIDLLAPPTVDGRILVPCLEALEEILVGPSPEQDELARRVEVLVRQHDLPVAVRKVTMPYRCL